MLPSTIVPPTETGIGALPITIADGATILWQPTFRDLYVNPTDITAVIDPTPQRTATTCFFRGIKETIEISTSDGTPWTWRRIMFSYKGLLIGDAYRDYASRQVEVGTGTNFFYYQRPNTSLPDTMASALYRVIFKGLGLNTDSLTPVDWINRMTAPIDTTRINVLYDKTANIRSGNESGTQFNTQRWHPINKNIVYNDLETGGTIQSSPNSTEGRPGIGDIYIVDMMSGSALGDDTGLMYFNPSSTVYWHEK